MKNPVELLQFSTSGKLKPILQAESSECGLACIAMVTNYYGYRIDLNSMRQKYSISLKGANLNSLIGIAHQMQLASRPLRLEMDELNALQLPCILHWDLTHFVVLKKVSRKYLLIIDPASGEKKLDRKRFAEHFTGVALELTPTKKFEKKKEVKNLKIDQLWDRVYGLKSTLLKIFVLSILLQSFAIVAPFYMQIVVDDVIVSHDQRLLVILTIGFLLLMIISAIITALRSLVIMLLGTQMNIQIANNIFRHLVHLPIEWFQKRHTGDVISRFASMDQIKKFLTTGIIETIVDGIMVTGTLVMMFIYSSDLAWLVVFVVLIYFIIRMVLYRPLRQLNEENLVAHAKEDSNFIESVRAIQSIKIFNREHQRQSIWQNCYANAMNTGIRLNKISIGYRAINDLLFGLENILVIYLAARNVIDGLMSVGMLYAFMSYKSQFTGKAASLIEKIIQFRMLGLHLSRLGDIVLSPVEPEDSVTGLVEISGKLELNNLGFRYSGTEPFVIDGASTVIKAGESVAITGSSGCGKTTLMKLMLGLLQPVHGQIMVDGIDIANLGNKNYRQQIAAVMQDDQLLSGTIADNICFFEQGVSQSRIEYCAKMAALHNDIMAMPMAYNSLVGDMGNTLSGGQKQRLLLARALYKKPKILFLDEATAHLDCSLENNVNDNINDLKMTRIIIAHREETIRSAGRVLTLEKGNLVE